MSVVYLFFFFLSRFSSFSSFVNIAFLHFDTAHAIDMKKIFFLQRFHRELKCNNEKKENNNILHISLRLIFISIFNALFFFGSPSLLLVRPLCCALVRLQFIFHRFLVVSIWIERMDPLNVYDMCVCVCCVFCVHVIVWNAVRRIEMHFDVFNAFAKANIWTTAVHTAHDVYYAVSECMLCCAVQYYVMCERFFVFLSLIAIFRPCTRCNVQCKTIRCKLDSQYCVCDWSPIVCDYFWYSLSFSFPLSLSVLYTQTHTITLNFGLCGRWGH